MTTTIDNEQLDRVEGYIRELMAGRGTFDNGFVRMPPGITWTLVDILRELRRTRVALELIVKLRADGDPAITDPKLVGRRQLGFDQGYDRALGRCKTIALSVLPPGRPVQMSAGMPRRGPREDSE